MQNHNINNVCELAGSGTCICSLVVSVISTKSYQQFRLDQMRIYCDTDKYTHIYIIINNIYAGMVVTLHFLQVVYIYVWHTDNT